MTDPTPKTDPTEAVAAMQRFQKLCEVILRRLGEDSDFNQRRLTLLRDARTFLEVMAALEALPIEPTAQRNDLSEKGEEALNRIHKEIVTFFDDFQLIANAIKQTVQPAPPALRS